MGVIRIVRDCEESTQPREQMAIDAPLWPMLAFSAQAQNGFLQQK